MKLSILFIVVLFALSLSAFSQENLADKIPVDPNVKIGKLDNGLTYYIRQNKKPEQKVELRLAVNVGSILEDDNQQGIAHLSEHMAFNGTTHFQKNDIVSFLQSIGVKFGNDLNAYTGFDETVYILPIPTDKPGNIDKGFQILEDWAHNVTYKSEDIDGERPVVLEESRLGKGARDRMFRKIYPQLFAGSLYQNRIPIGLDSIIKNQNYDVIRKFYKDWYRPDLMAVVIVGDIDPAKAEELVKKYFTGLKNPQNERPRTYAPVPAYTKNESKVVTDKEATSYSLIVNYSSVKTHPSLTIADYKQDLTKEIYTTLLNQRLRELTQKENPPFIFAFTDFTSYARGFESFAGTIGTGDKDATTGLKAFEEELERVKKFGFTKPELDRTKSDMLTEMERAYNEKNKTESENYTSEYVRNFLTAEPIPGIEKENSYYKELLPQISIEDVNNIGKILQDNSNQFIALTGPEPAAGKQLPSGDDLLAVATSVEKMDIKPYEEKVVSTSLLTTMPKPGKITNTKKNTVLGTTELTLDNGVTVTLKSTDFKNDEIVMSAIRPGGSNNYGVQDKYNVNFATAVIGSMGVGNFSPIDLHKALSGKTVSVTPAISDISEGMNARSSVKDIESMMQLLYLYFTSPRTDTSLFKSYIQKNKAQLAFLSANPQVTFIDTLFKTIYHNDPLAKMIIPKPEYFDQVNLERAMQIYKERFGDVNGMHFTFVGSFKEMDLQPLIEKYIASLPSTSKKFTYVDNKVRPVNGKVNITVNKGKEQKSLILAIYHGEVPYTDALDLKADVISEILNIKIIEELREKIQGIYGGNIQAQLEKFPYPHYSFVLQLPCGPEKVDTLLYTANKEISDLVTTGPSKENLEKVKQQLTEKYKVDVKENSAWLAELESINFPGSDPDYFINYEKYLEALTQKDVQDAAKLLLSSKDVVTGVLMPEKK